MPTYALFGFVLGKNGGNRKLFVFLSPWGCKNPDVTSYESISVKIKFQVFPLYYYILFVFLFIYQTTIFLR